ncbi:DUF4254 domain-containing protein [Nocardiopsis alba]|uniref:DUF4254 domain-containing protein n=1 Tax=Nocardiopsis alba TaxID=53437 RepID=UPI0036728EB0
MSIHPPPLECPPLLLTALEAQASVKDQGRVKAALEALHTANVHLWDAEDRVREPGAPSGVVADCKREIDQLNAARNRSIEQADEVLGSLADQAMREAPVHTETLGSVLDRLSILILRRFHTRRIAADDMLASKRLPELELQEQQLREAIDALISEVMDGSRRLPSAPRLKLYGRSDSSSVDIRVSPRVKQVIAFGGLSESGKSSGAIYLKEHAGAVRLKMGYLLREGARLHGLSDPYRLSPRRQAEVLVEMINRFAEGHTDHRLYTIESVHDIESIQELKKLMGDKLQILYLEVPFEERVRRAGTGPDVVSGKDEIKRSRGAHLVSSIADHVIDNSASIGTTRARLMGMAAPAEKARLRTVDVPALGLPAPLTEATEAFLRSRDDRVRLVCMSGSAAEGHWFPGWSDMDLLMVTSQEHTAGLRARLELFRSRVEEHGVHLGTTLVTEGEIRGHRVPPRVSFVLHQLHEGTYPALHAAGDLTFPRLPRETVEMLVSRDLPQVMLTLRRLLCSAEPTRLRPLFKHVVLACRLLLIEHDQWFTGPDQILAGAAAYLPGMSTLEVPPLVEVVDAWCDRRQGTVLPRVVDAADTLLSWYSAQTIAA